MDIQADLAAVQARIAQITGSDPPPASAQPGNDAFAALVAQALHPNAAMDAISAQGSPSTGLNSAALLSQLGMNPAGSGTGRFLMPAQGPISSPFGVRANPLGPGSDFHPGIDIAADAGAPIRAAAGGRVIAAGPEGGYGNVVVVDHGNGLTTRYAHCSEIFATVGESVTAGDEIALVGSTGRSTGPHLHFEVRQGERPVDPMGYLTSSNNAAP